MDGHLVFNGSARTLKCFVSGGELKHTLPCHDVGISDQYVKAGQDEYGSRCKCPPGDYSVGVPMACAIRQKDGSIIRQNSDDQAYGCYFVPLGDSKGAFAAHGRSGIGIHGGGSDLSNPFAMQQGWEWTYGCLRLQNQDLEQTLVPFINFIHAQGGKITLSVVWP